MLFNSAYSLKAMRVLVCQQSFPRSFFEEPLGSENARNKGARGAAGDESIKKKKSGRKKKAGAEAVPQTAPLEREAFVAELEREIAFWAELTSGDRILG